MTFPVRITYRNMSSSPSIDERIHEEAAKLGTFSDRIQNCRVVVDLPHRHHQHGKVFHLGIDLTLPGGEIVVNHEPSLHSTIQQTVEKNKKKFEVEVSHEYLTVAISEAFAEARRQLLDYLDRHSGQTKSHEPAIVARVGKLFLDRNYGFLETEDGREIYFHKNSVLHKGFNHLEVGTEVAFVEENGIKGPQASTVRILHSKHRNHQHQGAEVSLSEREVLSVKV